MGCVLTVSLLVERAYMQVHGDLAIFNVYVPANSSDGTHTGHRTGGRATAAGVLKEQRADGFWAPGVQWLSYSFRITITQSQQPLRL